MKFLSDFLSDALDRGYADSDQISVVEGLALAAKAIDHLIKRNGLEGDLGSDLGGVNADGDSQKALDLRAEEIIIRNLDRSGAAALLSEEQNDPVMLNEQGSVIVAVDPLDGSSNISVNVTIGTIFSLLPAHGDAAANIFQKGRAQLAAGFFTYGPQTTLILGFAGGGDVMCFVLDPDHEKFVLIGKAVSIPKNTEEFAINSAYTNQWYPPMQAWMADTLEGKAGICGKNYRMRWVGSLVADAWRIFQRGGVFLYPADKRPGNETGRLRLVYEANPVAFLAEKAGGLAIDGRQNILDLMPQDLHERVPFFFGAENEIKRLQNEHEKT